MFETVHAKFNLVLLKFQNLKPEHTVVHSLAIILIINAAKVKLAHNTVTLQDLSQCQIHVSGIVNIKQLD